MPAPWIAALLEDLRELPPAQAVQHLLQHLHNEMQHGQGQTQPALLTQQLCDAGVQVGAAVEGAPAPDKPLGVSTAAPNPPPPPAPKSVLYDATPAADNPDKLKPLGAGAASTSYDPAKPTS